MDGSSINSEREILIVDFGGAQIVQTISGSLELRGGTECERRKALEWLERYLPEALESVYKVKINLG